MTWFGYVLIILFALSMFAPESTSKTRVSTLLMIAGILFVGTGTGL